MNIILKLDMYQLNWITHGTLLALKNEQSSIVVLPYASFSVFCEDLQKDCVQLDPLTESQVRHVDKKIEERLSKIPALIDQAQE